MLKKRGMKSSVFFKRLICVMTWCALMLRRNPAGRGLDPFLGGGFLQQLAKGKVDFDCVELRRVVMQEFCLGQAWRDKSRASSLDKPTPMCRHRVAP